MRKILMLCSIAFMVSCSNDSETSSTPQNQNEANVATTASRPLPPVEDSIDSMFYAYVTSDIYITTDQLITDFNSDMNLSSDTPFKTRALLLSWIGTNIHLTNFSSIENATLRWNTIESNVSLLRIQFPDVYEFIAYAPNTQVIHKLDKWLNQNVPFGDPCLGKYQECTKAAGDSFKEGVADEISLGGNDFSCAQRDYKMATDVCDKNLKDCHDRNRN